MKARRAQALRQRDDGLARPVRVLFRAPTCLASLYRTPLYSLGFPLHCRRVRVRDEFHLVIGSDTRSALVWRVDFPGCASPLARSKFVYDNGLEQKRSLRDQPRVKTCLFD
jgi:hypothetical protein